MMVSDDIVGHVPRGKKCPTTSSDNVVKGLRPVFQTVSPFARRTWPYHRRRAARIFSNIGESEMHRLLFLAMFFYQKTNSVYGIECATTSYEAALDVASHSIGYQDFDFHKTAAKSSGPVALPGFIFFKTASVSSTVLS
ncbi:unnamed protein product [Heligmosomoides polygyrus]|uniref:ANF_receptor domain-containing protein n=1 Tax=Heligmosomoides polygyrus TaxID=6339 RepID=A0A183FSC9_HELPZ|nr:unnamed protein product [Heligmosomoides polygyrus]